MYDLVANLSKDSWTPTWIEVRLHVWSQTISIFDHLSISLRYYYHCISYKIKFNGHKNSAIRILYYDTYPEGILMCNPGEILVYIVGEMSLRNAPILLQWIENLTKFSIQCWYLSVSRYQIFFQFLYLNTQIYSVIRRHGKINSWLLHNIWYGYSWSSHNSKQKSRLLVVVRFQ